MGTELQVLYDMFLAKVNRDNMSPSYIYTLIKPAISKNFRQFKHSTDIVLTDSEEFEGYFIEKLDYDELECTALQMAIDFLIGNDMNRLLSLKSMLGTKDFCKLTDKKSELECVEKDINLLKTQLNELKSDMNTYGK